MTMNGQTTIDGDIGINFPAAWKPPQCSTRSWSLRVLAPIGPHRCSQHSGKGGARIERTRQIASAWRSRHILIIITVASIASALPKCFSSPD